MARGKSSAKAARVQPEPQMESPASATAAGSNGSVIEQQVVAFAEQLGRIVGTVQARAEGWLDPATLNDQITRVRDGAASLLQQLGATTAAKDTALRRRGGKRMPAAREPGSTATARSRGRSGGAVDAPGKKHRKPTPNESPRASATDNARIAKMKAVNASRRRGRG
jgi:hypothetical protein